MPRSKPTRKKRSEAKTSVKLAGLPDMRAMEGLSAGLAGALDGDQGTSDLDRAQHVMYQAWDTDDEKQRVCLAKKALKISPLCADAYVILAEHCPIESDEALRLYRKGVEAGEKALGKVAFQEDAGQFWAILETRPYMRAREGLALCLLAHDKFDEAVTHYEDMLRLNPNDNQGLRYELASWYLILEHDEDLAPLLEDYDEDASAAWSYTKALAAFRRGGDDEHSRALFLDAFEANPYVPEYLLGIRELPEEIPLFLSPGGQTEAIHFNYSCGFGWRSTPGALEWLRQLTETQSGPLFQMAANGS